MSKSIIFLGAGASGADGAPLQDELFRTYAASIRAGFHADEDQYRENQTRMTAFFRDFFNIDVTSSCGSSKILFPTFEEALGVLDLAIAKNERYRGCTCSLEDLRKALIFSMEAAIQFELDHEKKSHGRHHKELVENLKPPLTKHEITLITTNYDLLADNAIQSADARCDYGFSSPEPGHESTIRLLKIHGSLNWLFCPVCKRLRIGNVHSETSSADMHLDNSLCTACHSALTSVIVPPTYYKDMSNPYLRRVYEETEQELMKAGQIIFCGYSFPDADMHIKYMLKRAEHNPHRAAPLEIKVINHGDNLEEETRYKRFFKTGTKVDYLKNVSFEDFANAPYQHLL